MKLTDTLDGVPVFPLEVEGTDGGIYALDLSTDECSVYLAAMQEALAADKAAEDEGRTRYTASVMDVVKAVVVDSEGNPPEDMADIGAIPKRLLGRIVSAVMEQVLGLGKPTGSSSDP